MDPHTQQQPLVAVGGGFYRSATRFVAGHDMTLCAIELCGLLTWLTWIPTNLRPENFPEIPPDKVFRALLIFFGVHGMYSVVKIWMSFRLHRATREGTPLGEAVDDAKSWRSFRMVTSAIYILFGVVAGLIMDPRFLLGLGWRAGSIFVVHKFIGELEEEMVRGGGGGGGAEALEGVREGEETPQIIFTISTKAIHCTHFLGGSFIFGGRQEGKGEGTTLLTLIDVDKTIFLE